MSCKEERCKEKEIQNGFLKLTICLFLLFFCLMFSLLWKYWPKLGCKYSSFSDVVSVCLPLYNYLLHVKMNPSSYGPLGMFASYAEWPNEMPKNPISFCLLIFKPTHSDRTKNPKKQNRPKTQKC